MTRSLKKRQQLGASAVTAPDAVAPGKDPQNVAWRSPEKITLTRTGRRANGPAKRGTSPSGSARGGTEQEAVLAGGTKQGAILVLLRKTVIYIFQ